MIIRLWTLPFKYHQSSLSIDRKSGLVTDSLKIREIIKTNYIYKCNWILMLQTKLILN